MANKRYNADYMQTEIYKLASIESCKQLRRLFTNNRYLLDRHKMTLKQQIEDFAKYGLTISWATVRNLKNGVNDNAGFLFCSYFAVYWGYNVVDLIYKDFGSSLPECDSVPYCSYKISCIS